MITVRDSKREDAEAVRAVEASATTTLRQVYCPNRKAWRHRQSISRSLCRLVAESDGAIVGTTQYVVVEDVIRVIGLGVHHDFRRQGVARALIGEVARQAQSCGIRFVVLHTVEQTGNVPIFEALGFHVRSRCPEEYAESITGGELTDVCLELRMAASVTSHDDTASS